MGKIDDKYSPQKVISFPMKFAAIFFFKFNDHKHPCSENWPKKINYTMKVISSCIAFFVGIGRRLCCYEALVIGDQTWFITKFSHSRSSLLQSLSLLFPVLGYVLFPMLLDTIKSNHLVLNRPPPICRYFSVKRQPGPELTSFMVTCYHNTIQIELRVFPRTILLMVSWIDRKMQWK